MLHSNDGGTCYASSHTLTNCAVCDNRRDLAEHDALPMSNPEIVRYSDTLEDRVTAYHTPDFVDVPTLTLCELDRRTGHPFAPDREFGRSL